MLGKVHSLKPILFKDMMIESQEQIAKEKENIDAINVFPIPDGDTGSNIYYTIRSIVDEVNLINEGNGEKIFQAISKGSFIGAKGNSGIIYSQFLIGVVDYLDTAKEVTPTTFTEALKDGTEFAYESVLNPTEGTILTVMKEVTEKATELISQNPEINWIDFINHLVETSWDCLARTKYMLDVLKEANVVDAGAKGFVHILESWRDIIVKE